MSEIEKIMDLRSGQKVEIGIAPLPKSVTFIRKKLNRGILSKKEIRTIINDIVNNSLSEPEVAIFVSSMHK